MLKLVGTGERTATRRASEPRKMVAQYAQTELRKASFAVRVIEPSNKLPVEQKKNEISSKVLKRIRKRENRRPS